MLLETAGAYILTMIWVATIIFVAQGVDVPDPWWAVFTAVNGIPVAVWSYVRLRRR